MTPCSRRMGYPTRNADLSPIQTMRNGKRWHDDYTYNFDHQTQDVRKLKAWGLKQVTIGAIVGLSQARVSQILSQ